jgi:hypothetical protein
MVINLASNYEKGMFEQLQAALSRIDELGEKVKRIERETENKYLKIIYEKEAEIERLKKENSELRARIVKLEAEVERLRKQLGNNSSNSSNPPSTDKKPSAPNTYNSRTKTGKKSGGQKGHKGKYLSRAAIEEKIAKGQIKHRIINHGTPTGSYISKYVIDINMRAIATEHRFYSGASIPIKLRPAVQYGSDIKAFVATLVGQGLIASNRIVDMLAAWTNGALELSDGTVYNFLAEFNSKAAGFIESARTKLLNSAVMHIDETGARINGNNMFYRNYSNEERVLYTVSQTKGKKSIEEDGILPQYIGTLVHDHTTVNYNYGTNNAECNVHLIRYLKANLENTHHCWSEDMIEFLLSLKNSKELAIAFAVKKFEEADLTAYRKRYDEILAEGFKVLKETKSRFYQKEERKLLNRLKKYRNNHLLFAVDFLVPFDNNLSERDLRMVKTKGKVSGCFRSLYGARIFANLMSVIKTAIKEKVSPYTAIQSIINEKCCLA